MREIPLSEVKATLSDCVRAVETGEFLIITRHNKPVAALVLPENVERLSLLKAAGPEGGLASLTGGWEGSEDLVQTLQETSRSDRSGTSSTG